MTYDLAGTRGLNFVMIDRETGSRWQQATGEAFEGPMKGKRLDLVPFSVTTWAEWRAQYPHTFALVPEPRYQAQYQLMARRVSNLLRARTPDRPTLRDDPRLPPHEQVYGLEAGGGYKAYPIAVVRKQTVLNDQVGSLPVLLLHNSATDTTTAFARSVRGRTLTFRAAPSGVADGVVDAETGSQWTFYGECTEGALKGAKLDPITPLPSFWFSWAQFFPQTEIFSAESR